MVRKRLTEGRIESYDTFGLASMHTQGTSKQAFIGSGVPSAYDRPEGITHERI